VTSPARRRLRSILSEAARDAQAAGVPLGQIAEDLRQLAVIYDPAGNRPAVTPEEES
jgi:hypothetical protein